ncbi:AraC family transcriptional regulator [Mycobacterium sp. BMJ-28]
MSTGNRGDVRHPAARPEAYNGPQPSGSDGEGLERLASYTRFLTTDREVAERETAKLLSPHRLELAGADPHLNASVRFATLGSVSLYCMNYSSAVSIDRPSQNEYMTILAPLHGTIYARHQKEDFVARSGESMVVLSGGDNVHMEWSDDCAVVSLRADTSELRATLQNLAPDADERALRFEAAVTEPHARKAIGGVIELMTGIFDSYESIDAIPSRLSRCLREQALNTILLGVPHTRLFDILSPKMPISRRAVREAVDMVEADTMAELTVGDIAKRVGVGIRALEVGFQRELHCTPRSYIHRIRMERAHQDLVEADARSGATVTEIAQRWGFAHTGRFAAGYTRRFGVPPSQTLRRSAP